MTLSFSNYYLFIKPFEIAPSLLFSLELLVTKENTLGIVSLLSWLELLRLESFFSFHSDAFSLKKRVRVRVRVIVRVRVRVRVRERVSVITLTKILTDEENTRRNINSNTSLHTNNK